jgi:hypothetical protein
MTTEEIPEPVRIRKSRQVGIVAVAVVALMIFLISNPTLAQWLSGTAH